MKTRDSARKETKVKVICAWCGRVLREGPAEPVSHGMCQQCSETWLRGIEPPVDSPHARCSQKGK